MHTGGGVDGSILIEEEEVPHGCGIGETPVGLLRLLLCCVKLKNRGAFRVECAAATELSKRTTAWPPSPIIFFLK